MNRTNDERFFLLWDKEKTLQKMRERYLSPKELLEYQALEELFFEKAGYYPTFNYQQSISNFTANE